MKRIIYFFVVAICLFLHIEYIFAVWVDVDGTAQESINISNNSGESSDPDMYLDNAGNPHIIWVDYSSGNPEIYYLKWNGVAWVDADGTGQESINISNTSGSSYWPSMSFDSGGNPCVVWYDSAPGNNEIYYLKWDGSAWVDADGVGQESINVSNTGSASRNPSLFIDGAGNPCIAWWEASSVEEIYYLKWNGTAWVDADGTGRDNINISNTSSYSYDPSLYLDAFGNPHIAWKDSESGYNDIFYLRWNGSAWVDADGVGRESANISNSPFDVYEPYLCLDNSGNPNIAWSEDTSMGLDIYYLKWNGSAWVDVDGVGQGNKNISNTWALDAYYPSLFIDVSGNMHVAWHNYTAAGSEIYYQKWNGSEWVDADGTGLGERNTSNTPGWSLSPALCLDASGNPHVVWFDNTEGNYEIYYLKWVNVLTATSTVTSTRTEITTSTPTNTKSPTSTVSYTQTIMNTYTPTVTFIETFTVTESVTQTFTHTSTVTKSATNTGTVTIASTVSPSKTVILTGTPVGTHTATSTITPTSTKTPSSTKVFTFTVTPTSTITPSASLTPTITTTPTPWPEGFIQVYPNPFNKRTCSQLKFNNLYRNSTVNIYTMLIEFVVSIKANDGLAVWECKNRFQNEVSQGLYYYVISNDENSTVFTGKLMIVDY